MDALSFLLLQYPPTPAAPGGGGPAAIDLTSPQRILLDDLGSINRAVERDLLSFRTGDLTLALENKDAFCDELFSGLAPSDRWQLLVRAGERDIFRGIILGKGSIKFDRKAKTCELTAYGASKVLDDASAESARRTDILSAYALNANAAAGATSLTLVSTAGLLPGDILHLTDQVNKEDVTIKQTTSSTVIDLEAGLSNAYNSGSPLTLSTPYFWYRTVQFLIGELAKAAGIGVIEILLNNSRFKKCIPSPTNLNGLDLAAGGGTWQWGPASERLNRLYITLVNASPGGPGTYYQPIGSPDAAWVKEDAGLKSWIDWSKFVPEGGVAPATLFRNVADEISSAYEPFNTAYDFASASPFKAWSLAGDTIIATVIQKWTSNDGLTWTGAGFGAVLNPTLMRVNSNRGIEKDGARDGAYVCWHGWDASPAEHSRFQYWVPSTDTASDLMGLYGDDAGKEYCAPCYIPDLDYTLVLRGVSGTTTGAGPVFDIAAWRGKTRLWVRPFPNARINADGGGEVFIYPTHSARYIGGSIYMLVYNDGAVQLLRTDDEFRTYTMRRVANPTNRNRMFGARIAGQYAFFCYGTSPKKFWEIGAPGAQGVVQYLDNAGKSVAESLRELAVLTNAVFWVDESMQLHFVARDLLPAGDVRNLDSKILEQSEDQLWDQQSDQFKITGGGVTATSGPSSSPSNTKEISSAIVPNEAFAQFLADEYRAFFSPKRTLAEVELDISDQQSYRPLDRVTIGASRYLVYEADEDLGAQTARLSLLEDA